MAEKWANTSSPPSLGVMKLYPLLELNHFTVPVVIHPPGAAARPPRVARKQIPYPASRTRYPGIIFIPLFSASQASERAPNGAHAGIHSKFMPYFLGLKFCAVLAQ